MNAEDIILAGCLVICCWALLPQIARGFCRRQCGVHWLTSALTAGALTISAACLFRLHLHFSASATGFSALCWWTLFAQSTLYGDRRP